MNEKGLSQLFSSSTKIRILKIFMRNPNENFDVAEIARRSQLPRARCRSHIKSLVSLRVIKQTTNAKKKTSSKKGKK